MEGLLVHIADKKATAEELLRRAFKFYKDRYMAMPTHCQVSTRQEQFDASFNDVATFEVDGVTVERRRSVLLNHYFMYEMDKQND
jgi:hypothetical protein